VLLASEGSLVEGSLVEGSLVEGSLVEGSLVGGSRWWRCREEAGQGDGEASGGES
jgi:hypothetical protein